MPANANRDPLHGKTLQAIVEALVERFGWEELGRRIPIKCFTNDPSIGSSLKFLRKTGWARERVEGWYLATFDDGPGDGETFGGLQI